MEERDSPVSRGSSRATHHSPLLPSSPGFRYLAMAAATEERKKTGKKHPGKAILAGG